jgi:hypothetical protein
MVSYYRKYTEPLTLRICPKFGRGCNIETLGVYGGVPKGMQMRRLNLGVQVIYYCCHYYYLPKGM